MNKFDRLLADVVLAAYFGDQSDISRDAARVPVAALVHAALDKAPDAFSQSRREHLKSIRHDVIARPPPDVDAWLERAVLFRARLAWARTVAESPPRNLEEDVSRWFQQLAADDQRRVLGAAIRHEIGLQGDSDRELGGRLRQALVPSKENSMASHTFDFDSRGLPASLKDPAAQQAWEKIVDKAIENQQGRPIDDTPKTIVTFAAVKGMLLLDEVFDVTNGQFQSAVRDVWTEALDFTIDAHGHQVENRDVYTEIALQMVADGRVSRPTNVNQPPHHLIYQQLGSVCRYVIANAAEVPFLSPLFPSQVRLGMDRYVAGPPPAETLDIPPLTGDTGPDGELDEQNMLAFSTLYAIRQLDDMGVYTTIDWIVEDFLNGVLASGFDAVGKQLDKWFWTRRDRMTEADRRSISSRMMGAPGGDVSKEIQPNKDFEDRLISFISAVAEFDRQQRISDLFTNSLAGNGGRSLVMTMENVRQKGQALASNMSVYSYGYTHFAARRANADFAAAFDILKNADLQRLLGVTNPYQVIEKTFTQRTGKAPDIVRLRTMAESGKKILDIVARNTVAWSTANGKPLFPDLNRPAGATNPSAIPYAAAEELIRQSGLWLAVNGVADQQVDTYARPALKPYESSIPSSNVMTPASSNGAGAAMDKIKQMVASGQTPSLDQLKSVLPAGFAV